MIAAARGRAPASRWYWMQLLRSVLPLTVGRVRDGLRVVARINLRYTCRLIARAPSLSAAVILTLALGIGANTAVFSVIDAVILRPLPYPAPDRLVSVWESSVKIPRMSVSPADFREYKTAASFASLAAYQAASMTTGGPGAPETLAGEAATANFLPMLGASPIIGRTFTDADGQPGAERVVVITNALWKSRFNADPEVLGRRLVLDNQPRTIIGVLPADFIPLTTLAQKRPVAFIVPAPNGPDDWASRDHELFVVGRLRPGVDAVAAQRELDVIAGNLARNFPNTNKDQRAGAALLAGDIVRNVRQSLLVMMGAVALVALIACVNVANLLIVWVSAQQRDMAVRLAIGASRGDIVAECLARGLLLALLGGAIGLVLAVVGRDALVALAPASIPRLDSLKIAGSVLWLTTTLTVGAGIFAGIVPAIQLLRGGRVNSQLQATSRSAGVDRATLLWRGMLLTAEVTAAVMLALGAGLLMRSMIRLNHVDLGYRTDHVVAMRITLSPDRYPTDTARLQFFEALSARLKAMPGIENVAYANEFPMRGGWGGRLEVMASGGPEPAEADLQVVSPDYFSTFRIAPLRGRLFNDTDRATSEPSVIVSETFVRRYAGGRDPIGLQLRRNPSAPLLTVVGVVGEIRRDGKLSGANPQVYFAAAQPGVYSSALEAVAVRTTGDPALLIRTIRDAVYVMEPAQLISRIAVLDRLVDASVAPRRFNSWLLGVFAGLAVLLTIVGVYGVVSHVVSLRTREIGIRIALGASRAEVMRIVVLSGLRWATAGIVIGLAGALGASRWVASMLFEVAPNDALTFTAIAVAMLAVSAAASYLPARRAARTDPLAALRAD